MRTTPSVREFTDEAIPDQVVYELLDVARFAPNGGNRQSWKVILVKDPGVRLQLRDLYAIGWREYVAHTKRGEVPFAASGRGRLNEEELAEARATPSPNHLVDHLHEVPVLLAVTADLDRLATTDIDLNRHSIVGGASIYPFVHNILLAARDRGLGGVMTTMLCRQEPAVRPVLGIPEGRALASLVVLGRPVKALTRLRREAVEEFTTIDHWDGPSLMPA